MNNKIDPNIEDQRLRMREVFPEAELPLFPRQGNYQTTAFAPKVITTENIEFIPNENDNCE